MTFGNGQLGLQRLDVVVDRYGFPWKQHLELQCFSRFSLEAGDFLNFV